MFYLSLVFLALLAAILVLWIDVPRVVEVIGEEGDEAHVVQLSEAELRFEETAYRWGRLCGIGLLVLWPIFIAEQIVLFLQTRRGQSFYRKHPFWWLLCLIPPLRLCAHRRVSDEQVWFPVIGWQKSDRALQRRLERTFSFPMIGIALLILPVLGLQFYFKERIADYPELRITLHIGTGLIWFAFAVEFIVMVSVAEKRLNYCKKHWLDLVIILLPLISFLRTLRLLRAGSSLAKVGKLQQLTRVVRVYRLRGVAMRALRALMLLEVVHRLLRTTPESRIKKLELQYEEKQRELADLEDQIARLRLRLQPEAMDEDGQPDLLASRNNLQEEVSRS